MKILQALYSFVSVLIFFWASLGNGCSSSERTASVSFSANAGTATSFDFSQKSQFVLGRYQYVILRNEERGDMWYIETQWKERQPFPDELAQGITEAKTKFILQAAPRSRGGMKQSELNSVRIIGDNLVRFTDDYEWKQFPISDMLKAYFKKFAEDLETEFRTGIRKF